jgi:hypothetical protein
MRVNNLSVEDKERIMECVGSVLSGENRVLYGHRIKIIGYDHTRKGILIQYTDTKEFAVINKIHDIRRLI